MFFEVDAALAIFAVSIFATFGVAWLGKLHAAKVQSDSLANQELNKWLVGLSAGASANSGFVVTGAVGLGYLYGAQWLLLPLAWLLGDIVFWTLFPHRINRLAAAVRATTIVDVLTGHLAESERRLPKILIGAAIVVCVGGYVAAQWLAGQKFIHSAFGLPEAAALIVFALMIVGYTIIGGFRGSVYADSFQAVLRVFGTAVALGAVIWVAADTPSFFSNLNNAGPGFTQPFYDASLWSILAFFAGYGAAALGFGLGQPQIFTRYMAGANPDETRGAWWIYLSFVQFTWISMTAFGMILRGIEPELADPEAGVGVFFRNYMGPILTGIIVADVFATIAATSNSLLVAMSQTLRFDIVRSLYLNDSRSSIWGFTAILGIATMIASMSLQASVFGLAIASVSLLGAGIAPVMAGRLLGLRLSQAAILASVASGLIAASFWLALGLSSAINEVVPGMAVGFVVMILARQLLPLRTAQRVGD